MNQVVEMIEPEDDELMFALPLVNSLAKKKPTIPTTR
jgi:hypothetical protein